MGLPIIGDLLESGMKLAGKFITDKDKLAEYEAAFKQSLLSHEQAIIQTQASVINAENITDPIVSDMLSIVQVGLGGYVVGRSGEKIMAAYKANEK